MSGKPPAATLEQLDMAAQTTLDRLLSQTRQTASVAQTRIDQIVPPQQRADVVAKAQGFIAANPKLSAFLAINLAISGIPLVTFIGFCMVGFIGAMILGIVLTVMALGAFTIFAAGIAFTIVFPVLFFTTLAACTTFMWGMCAYYTFRWVMAKAVGDQPARANFTDNYSSNVEGQSHNASGDKSGYYGRVPGANPYLNGSVKFGAS